MTRTAVRVGGHKSPETLPGEMALIICQDGELYKAPNGTVWAVFPEGKKPMSISPAAVMQEFTELPEGWGLNMEVLPVSDSLLRLGTLADAAKDLRKTYEDACDVLPSADYETAQAALENVEASVEVLRAACH